MSILKFWGFKNDIFEKILDIAKIAKMNKKDARKYLKSLNDMGVVQSEIRRRDNTIAALQSSNTALQSSNTTLQSNNAALQNENAELRRRLGIK